MKIFFFVALLIALTICISAINAKSINKILSSINKNNKRKNIHNKKYLRSNQFPLGNLVNTLHSGTAGTGWDAGAINPGVQFPFGAMRLGPDTSIGLEPIKLPFQSEGGYSWLDSWLEGFSHTHVDGAGMAEWQNVEVTMVRAQSSDLTQPPVSPWTINNAGYKTKFRHETETAIPGYYSVNLDDHNVFAELTPTGTLSGMSRFECIVDQTASSQQDCVLIVDFAHGSPRTGHLLNFSYAVPEVQVIAYYPAPDGKSANITVRIINAGEFLKEAPTLGGINVYFQLNIELPNSQSSSATLAEASFWQSGEFVPLSNQVYANVTSRSSGVAIRVLNSAGSNAQPTTVLVRTGLSFLNYPFAQQNLQNQQYNSSTGSWIQFEDAIVNARSKWESVLEQFYLGGGVNTSDYTQTLGRFYGSIYRSYLAPTDYTEINGYFLGLDNNIHKNSGDARRYSDLSSWDTYRAENTFWIFANPSVARDVTNSMYQMAIEAESPPMNCQTEWPQWIMANVETHIMVGTHSAVSALESITKGVSGIKNPHAVFDKIVKAIRKQNERMTVNADGRSYCVPNGYGWGIGGTLEYIIDAAAVRNAALHSMFNNQSVADEMLPYTEAYRNVWNPEFQFFCDREANGTWACPANPWLPHGWEEGGFVEGNALEYQWYLPSNLTALLAMYRSIPYVADRLENFMTESFYWPFNTTIPNPYLWMGNEPVLAVPFTFNWLGNEYSWRTNHWLDRIAKVWWPDEPIGTIPGNDDYGAMSTLEVFYNLGFYPNPPTSNYALFAPKFPHIEVRLPLKQGQTSATVSVRIIAHGFVQGVTNYLKGASANGKPLATPILAHDDLMKPVSSGMTPTLEFFCAQTPVTFNGDGSKEPWMPAEKTEEEVKASVKKVEGIAEVVMKMFEEEKKNGFKNKPALANKMRRFL